MAKITFVTEMTVEDKSFTTEKGETVDYLDTTVMVGNTPIGFRVKPSDKNLLLFLLNNEREAQKQKQ